MRPFDPKLDLELTRLFTAPPAKVWRCWTEPALFCQWWTPPPVTTREAVIEAFPGGRFYSLMVMPEGKEADVYELTYTLVHKTSGEKKEVSDRVYMDEEIWKDERWEIVGEPRSRLVRKGYPIPIPDLMISDAEGQDVTAQVLENPEENFIVVAWDLNSTSRAGLEKVNALVREAARAYHIRPVLLTAAGSGEAEAMSKEMGWVMEVLYADAVPLKSMVRSNPGVLLMRDGVIVEKWHYNTLPGFDQFERKYLYGEE